MRFAWLIGLALLAGCTAQGPRSAPSAPDEAKAALMRHIETLASDEYGGRQPGTEGEAKTLRYLSREWQSAGLVSGTNDPANPWFAPVELAMVAPDGSYARFYREGRPIALPEGGAVVFSASQRGLVERAPVVFVGRAGEDLDRAAVAGRIAVATWDHPRYAEQREALITVGAAAVLAIVSNDVERADLIEHRRLGAYRLGGSDPAGALEGFLSPAAFTAMVGADRAASLMLAARNPDFRPVALEVRATLEATAAPATVRTYNLIAKLPGRRPAAGAVLLLAHWDHFGRCAAPPAEDLICNGAVDNASGLAVLTELAKRLATGPRIERDVYFLATTAEEWGLLGAQAFAQNPPVPLDSIVAAFNLDSVAVAPTGSPVAIVGRGMTPLDAAIAEVVNKAGRRLADGSLADGYVRRQDGWALLQRDIPAVSVSSAFALAEPLERFTRTRYHLPSDEPADIELGGAVEDLALHVALVRHFADPARWPGSPAKTPAAP